MVSGLVKIISIIANRMEHFSKTSHRCTSRKMRVSNIGAMCEFDQNEDTFLVYFDELDIINGQKQHT